MSLKPTPAINQASHLIAVIFALLGARAFGQVTWYSVTPIGQVAYSWYAGAPLLAINDSGIVVGTNVASHAFMYSNGTMTDLGTLGGPTSSAFAINNLGTIVGTSRDSLANNDAFIYSDGVMTSIGGA